MSIEKALGKLRAAQMCHPNAVQALIDEAIAAIQQAEAQQPATGEPVYQICKKDSQSISSAWIDVEKQAYEDAGIYPEYGCRTLYTHPAPSVPGDVVRDAERYRWLRASTFPKADQYPYRISTKPIRLPIGFDDQSTFDAAIDAAMLAAK